MLKAERDKKARQRYEAKYPDRVRDAKRRWRERNRERLREKNRQWYLKNRERYLAKRLAEKDADREAYRARKRKWDGKPDPIRPCPAVCECCGKPPGAKALHLDHDHATGKFRGWLCDLCNRGVGMLGDNLDGVLKMVEYLKRAQR